MKEQKRFNWQKMFGMAMATIFLLCVVAMPVFAYAEEDITIVPPRNEPGDGVRRFFAGFLARTFRYQVSMTEFIGDSLESADGSVNRAEDRLEALIEEGHDVETLETALADFEGMLDEAENAYNAAQSLVELHSGFDEDGRVLEIEEARKTVAAIEPNIKEARETIVEAVKMVYEAIQEYREANNL